MPAWFSDALLSNNVSSYRPARLRGRQNRYRRLNPQFMLTSRELGTIHPTDSGKLRFNGEIAHLMRAELD
jgi:hypothetical protein